MKIMFRLAVKQLLKNRKRMAITIIGIVLSVSMITAVAGFVAATREMMRQTFIVNRGDYHVGFYPVTEAQAAALAADRRVESSFIDANQTRINEEEGKLAFYFRLRNVNRQYEQTATELAEAHGVTVEIYDFNKELLAVEGVIAGDSSFNTLLAIGGIVTAIILLGSVIVIANAFNISAQERIRQFGVLKSAGATKAQIRQTVLAEGLALSVVAIPIGILAGFAVEAIALAIANGLLYEVNVLNNGALEIKPVYSGLAVVVAAILSLATVLISAWIPAAKAAKISAIEAISLSNEIKIKGGAVRTSPLIAKLFGFEGTLAAKALRRSRGKYRATIISLVVSIVLFVLATGFGTMLSQSADMVYTDFGVNVMMYLYDGSIAEIEKINDGLSRLSGELNSTKLISASTEMPPGYLTPDAQRFWSGEHEENMTLLAINDALFEKISQKAGVSQYNASSDNTLRGILVNFSMMGIAGRRTVFKPFAYQKGDKFKLEGDSPARGFGLELVGAISDFNDISATIAPFVYTNRISVLIPESALRLLKKLDTVGVSVWAVKTEDSVSYRVAADTIFGEAALDKAYGITDFEQNYRVSKSIRLLMLTFIYGFVGMLSLIAVTSVLGTISTNIKLRLPELAMLSSVGMTPQGLRRMLNLESLFYGLKALAIGLPLSLALYYLMYNAFGISLDFAFIWPWQNMLISSAAVMLITFATMRYSAKQLQCKNTVELIRTMNL